MAIKNKFNSVTTNTETVFKNRIIGGDFSTNPWQRGTSLSVPSSTTPYLADRFRVANYSTTGVLSVTKVADAPTFAQSGVMSEHSMAVTMTTASSALTAGRYVYIYQGIEDYNVKDFGFGQPGTRYFTFSFWCKCNLAGKYSVSLQGGGRSYVSEFNVNTVDTWEKKIITVPVDTNAASWTYDTGALGLLVIITLSSSTTYSNSTVNAWQTGNIIASSNALTNFASTIGNYFKLANVQVEKGGYASDFENRSIGQELILCQRYFEKSYDQSTAIGSNTPKNVEGVSGTPAYPNGAYYPAVKFKVTKRANPTITLYSASTGTVGKITYAGGGEGPANSVVLDTNTNGNNGFVATNNSGSALNAVGILYYHWTADAEY